MTGLRERSGLDISLNITDKFGRFPRDMELSVFPIVQECLTNIHHHSGSKSARIVIACHTQFVYVTVQDQGKAMSPTRLVEIQSRGSKEGIRGIGECLRLFQGAMDIQSNGSGTRISVTIPIPKDAFLNRPVEDSPLQAAV